MRQLGSRILMLFVVVMKLFKPLLAVLTKILAVLAKLFKGAATTKFVLGASTFGIYSVLISWQFALCVMLLIGIHEYGHVWAMRRMGMATRGFYFIPLFGGMAVSDSSFPSAYAEWYVALMGPIWGLGVTLAAIAAYVYTDIRVFEVAACWMAFVNLINLIPMHPLDGGRVIRATSQSLLGKYAAFVVIGISAPLIAFATIKGYLLFTFLGIMGVLEELGQRSELRMRQAISEQEKTKAQRNSLGKFLSDLAVAIGLPADTRPDAIQLQLKKWVKRNGLSRIVSDLREIRRDYAAFEKKYRKVFPLHCYLPPNLYTPQNNYRMVDHEPSRIFTITSAEKFDSYVEEFDSATMFCRNVFQRNRAFKLLRRFKSLRMRMMAITSEGQKLFNRLTQIIPAPNQDWDYALPEQIPTDIRDELNAEKLRIQLFDSLSLYNDRWVSSLDSKLWENGPLGVSAYSVSATCFIGTCEYHGARGHAPSRLFTTLNPVSFALCLIDPDCLQKKYLEELYALTPPGELAMSRRTTVLTFAAYAALTALFFFLMALTGGHEAAQGAISFMSDLG